MFNSMKQAAEKAAAAAGAVAKQGIGAAKEAKERLTTNSKSSTAQPVVPDGAAVEQLVSMGFTRAEAEQALVQAGSSSVEAAAELLCSKGWKPSGQQAAPAAPTPTPARGGVPGVSASAASASSASTSTVIQERMRASIKDVKRRAESMLGKAQASMPGSSSAAAAAADPSPSMPFVGLASSAAHRRAQAEAAERRLAEARARNAGTMEDWRRYRQEQGQVRTSRSVAHETLQHRPVATVAGNVSFGHRPPSVVYVGVDDDEGEDVQRALAASLAPAASPQAPTTQQSKPDKAEPLVASAAQAAAATSEAAAAEADAPVPEATSAAAAAAAAAEEEGVEAEDPELFELMLQQALAEEELELQQALTHSIEAERALLEQERVEAACKAAAETTAPEETAEPGEEEAPAKPDLKDIEEQLAESLARERQVLEEQSAMEARVEELRRQVAEREGEATGAPAAADPEDVVAGEALAAGATAGADVAAEADTAGAPEPDVEATDPCSPEESASPAKGEETTTKEAPSPVAVSEEAAEKASVTPAAEEPVKASAETPEPEVGVEAKTEAETKEEKTAEAAEKPADEDAEDVAAESAKVDPEAKTEVAAKKSEAPAAKAEAGEAEVEAKEESKVETEATDPAGEAAPATDTESKREEEADAAKVEDTTEATTAEPAEEVKADPHPKQ